METLATNSKTWTWTTFRGVPTSSSSSVSSGRCSVRAKQPPALQKPLNCNCEYYVVCGTARLRTWPPETSHAAVRGRRSHEKLPLAAWCRPAVRIFNHAILHYVYFRDMHARITRCYSQHQALTTMLWYSQCWDFPCKSTHLRGRACSDHTG